MNSRQWNPTNVLVFLIKFDSIAALLWHKCYFVCKNRNFSPFPLQKRKIVYLCPAKPRENGPARESAFFALFLVGESGQFA